MDISGDSVFLASEGSRLDVKVVGSNIVIRSLGVPGTGSVGCTDVSGGIIVIVGTGADGGVGRLHIFTTGIAVVITEMLFNLYLFGL